MSKKIKLIIGLVVILFIITVLGLSKAEAAEVTEKQTKQLSKGKVQVVTETKKVNGEEVKVLKDVKLDLSAKEKGDVNGDGIVSVEDASYLLMKTVADTLKDEVKLSSDETFYADIDGDEMITAKDAQYVLTYYAKKAAGLNPSWKNIVNEIDVDSMEFSQNYEDALNYDININHSNSMKVLNESELNKIIEKSDVSDRGKENMKSVTADLVKYQEKYGVNAVFVMAIIRAESGWGIGWDLISPTTYNWASIRGNLNGGYIDRNGQSWNNYNSYSEASEAVFKLIAESGYYFGAQKYTVKEVCKVMNDNEIYGKIVAKYISEYYGYISDTQSDNNDSNNYSDTPYVRNDTNQIRKTGIEGYYKNGDKQYTVYAQGYNDVWGNTPYWTGTYGTDACGITSVATILTGFGVNKNPVDVNNDGIITNGNTLLSQLKDQLSKYGLYCSKTVFSNDAVIENLKKGNPVLVNLHNSNIGNNYYNGHYVALLGISDDGKIFLADSAGASVAGGNNTGYFEQDKILPALCECIIISNNNEVSNIAPSNFIESAKNIKEKTAIGGYTYGHGDPILDKQVNCASYISWSLYAAGYDATESANKNRLINSTTNLKKFLDNNNFEKVYEGKTLNVNDINLQPGDIIFEGNTNSESSLVHSQIYAGKNSNGENVWYNCGYEKGIQYKPGEDTVSSPHKEDHYIVYVYRVPNK